jgi:hypothetical protein
VTKNTYQNLYQVKKKHVYLRLFSFSKFKLEETSDKCILSLGKVYISEIYVKFCFFWCMTRLGSENFFAILISYLPKRS